MITSQGPAGSGETRISGSSATVQSTGMRNSVLSTIRRKLCPPLGGNRERPPRPHDARGGGGAGGTNGAHFQGRGHAGNGTLVRESMHRPGIQSSQFSLLILNIQD